MISICGLPRSGSTLIFQIVGNLLGWNNSLGYGWPKTYKKGSFFKIHDRPDKENLNVKYIYTYRDLRDIVASKKMIKKSLNFNLLETYQKNDYYYRSQNDVLVIKYESDIFNINLLIRKIATFLNIKKWNKNITNRVTLEENKKFIDKLTGFDPKTLFYPHHISDGKTKFKKYLTEIEIMLIESICYSWLSANHYKLLYNWKSVNTLCYEFNTKIIRKGDTLFSLFGENWKQVYESDKNKNLRTDCPDPNHIKPGLLIYCT